MSAHLPYLHLERALRRRDIDWTPAPEREGVWHAKCPRCNEERALHIVRIGADDVSLRCHGRKCEEDDVLDVLGIDRMWTERPPASSLLAEGSSWPLST